MTVGVLTLLHEHRESTLKDVDPINVSKLNDEITLTQSAPEENHDCPQAVNKNRNRNS